MRLNNSTDEVVRAIVADLEAIRESKRRDVEWKLRSVRAAFDATVAPTLHAARSGGPIMPSLAI